MKDTPSQQQSQIYEGQVRYVSIDGVFCGFVIETSKAGTFLNINAVIGSFKNRNVRVTITDLGPDVPGEG